MGRVSHVFITVCDFQVRVRLYRNVLGIRLLYTDNENYAFFCLSEGPAFQLALYRGRAQRGGDRSHWSIVVDVEEIESAITSLRARGVGVGAIMDVPFGRTATFEDPEGNLMEVRQFT